MKIVDLKVQALQPTRRKIRWWEEQPPTYLQPFVVRILTDEGAEGVFVAWQTSILGPPMDFINQVISLKKAILGEDPFNREKIWRKLNVSPHASSISSAASGAIDICLWDLAGKVLNLPIYKMIGGCRDRIKAYASTIYYPTYKEYVDLCSKLVERGYTAIKLHAYGIPEKDIQLCRAVRDAIGDHVDLMLDVLNRYSRADALKVGRELEKLNFYWFEAPIPDTDLDGLEELCRSLDIRVIATESLRSIYHYASFIRRRATDSLRCIGDLFIGGITSMIKLAHTGEILGLSFEPHGYGTTHVMAASLHVQLSIANSELFEIPVPEGLYGLDDCMKDVVRVEKDGYVYAPRKYGLGYEVDWDKVEKLKVVEKQAGPSC